MKNYNHASNRISPQAVAQLSLANPWPTREMSGVEVLVEDTFPYDLKNFYLYQQQIHVKLERPPTVIIRHRFVILWIIGDEKIEMIDNLDSKIFKNHQILLKHQQIQIMFIN